MRAKHILRYFDGFFEGSSTFFTLKLPVAAQLGIKKVFGPLELAGKYQRYINI